MQMGAHNTVEASRQPLTRSAPTPDVTQCQRRYTVQLSWIIKSLVRNRISPIRKDPETVLPNMRSLIFKQNGGPKQQSEPVKVAT
jgi:hypothetical protein